MFIDVLTNEKYRTIYRLWVHQDEQGRTIGYAYISHFNDVTDHEKAVRAAKKVKRLIKESERGKLKRKVILMLLMAKQ